MRDIVDINGHKYRSSPRRGRVQTTEVGECLDDQKNARLIKNAVRGGASCLGHCILFDEEKVLTGLIEGIVGRRAR